MLTKDNVKKASPGTGLPYRLEKNRSRPWVCFPALVATTSSPYQQVDLIRTVDMLTKKHPKQHGPRESLEKKLDGPLALRLDPPSGRCPPSLHVCHDQQSHNNTAELTQCCCGHSEAGDIAKVLQWPSGAS